MRHTLVYGAVKGNFVARLYYDCFAESDFRRVYFRFLSVAKHCCNFGTYVHKRGNVLAAFADGVMLKQLACLVQKHNGGSVGILADCKRADSGDGHQKVFVKHVAVADVGYSAPQYVVAYNQVHDGKQRQLDPLVEFQREVQGKGDGVQHGGNYYT